MDNFQVPHESKNCFVIYPLLLQDLRQIIQKCLGYSRYLKHCWETLLADVERILFCHRMTFAGQFSNHLYLPSC